MRRSVRPLLNLYTYFRSSAAYRVRIALNIKQLDYRAIPIHLLRSGGEHRAPAYVAINPQGLVPSLQHDAQILTQSLAIIEYLNDCFPTPALLPDTALGRAQVRAMALTIACDMHPLNNLRVLRHLQDLGVDEAARNEWYQRWIREGLASIEQRISNNTHSAPFCHGPTPTLADCCLVPQVYNALRFQSPMDAYPTVMRVYRHCLTLKAFAAAAPEAQPDHE